MDAPSTGVSSNNQTGDSNKMSVTNFINVRSDNSMLNSVSLDIFNREISLAQATNNTHTNIESLLGLDVKVQDKTKLSQQGFSQVKKKQRK